MIAISLLQLVLGGAALYGGAEWFVKGAAGLGRALGLRPLIVGLTVVAYGTSMPELVVSALAALDGHSAMAVGNVVGSNIANLGLILGATALVSPLRVEGALARRELPLLLGTALVIPLVLLDGQVSRVDGGLLLAGAVAFTALVVWGAPPAEQQAALLAAEEDAVAAGAPPFEGTGRLVLLAAVGLAIVLAGGKLLVEGASQIALALGVSERIVGLTVVAVGTSVPELASSLVAALRGHAAIAVGNVIGSNIFNVLFVLGGVAVIEPVEGTLRDMWVDLGAMLALSIVATFLLRKERVVGRGQGFGLLAAYAAFLALLAAG